MIHAILIFGLGFTLFQIQERFDPQRVVNVKFANANFDSLGNLSSLNNTQETINDEERSAANNVSNQSFQAMSIRRLEANSLQNDSESRYLNSWQRKVETIGFYETNRISFEQDSMTRKIMQILAIDFGLKKVGLAIGNTLTKTSMPISTIFYKSKQELFNLLEKHVIEWKPEFIIIGNPLNMDQTESEMSKLAEKFSTQFSKKFNLAVELVDERLSSFEAKEFTKDDNLDAMAAKLILDSWMNNNEHS